VTYQPIGHALDLFKTREKFVAIVGPARCGKSRAALEKCLLFGMKYPGSRVLFVRKVRASMTESILETFESYVAPKGSPWVDNVTRASRTKYVLPNGTEVIIAGMDMPSKILSSEYDYIYAGESCELEEEDYEVLTSRLSGRNAPYRQFVMDTNPGAPTHWIKRRIDSHDLHLIQFDFKDNPVLDPDVIATLSKLTGHRRKRLFEGFWSAAEGVVFDLGKCTIDEDEIPAGEVYGGHDFGWSAPAANVVGVVYKDTYGRDVLYVYAAEQQASVPAEVQAQKMLTMGGPECCWFADPSNPEGIRELGKHGVRVFEATNAILFGIDAVNSLIEGERLFVSAKLRDLLDVTAGYAYDKDGIKPVKENDHLPDALRYLVASLLAKNLIEVGAYATAATAA